MIVGLEAVHCPCWCDGGQVRRQGCTRDHVLGREASRDFAARNGRIEIIEGRHLKALLLEHLGLDVLISLPKLPTDWDQHDVS